MLILTVGVISALFLNSADGDIQTRLKDRTSKFVDSARATGKIDPNEYLEYVAAVANCGEFEATIKVSRNITYATTTTGDIASAQIGIAQDEVLAYMFPEGSSDNKSYPLNNGDRVNVSIRRTGAGLTSLLSLIGRGGRNGDLICEYSGTVYRTGSR